jgi:hypothetical protein
MILMLKELNKLETPNRKEIDKLKKKDSGQFNRKPTDN